MRILFIFFVILLISLGCDFNNHSEPEELTLSYSEIEFPNGDSTATYRKVNELMFVVFDTDLTFDEVVEVTKSYGLSIVEPDYDCTFFSNSHYLQVVRFPDHKTSTDFVSEYPRTNNSEKFGNLSVVEFSQPLFERKWGSEWFPEFVSNEIIIEVDSTQNESLLSFVELNGLLAKPRPFDDQFVLTVTPNSKLNVFELIILAQQRFHPNRIKFNSFACSVYE